MAPPSSSRKRKAPEPDQNDDSEPAKVAPRLSRKQKLEAARARAKAAMASDKKNVEAIKAERKAKASSFSSSSETPSKRRKTTAAASKKTASSSKPKRSADDSPAIPAVTKPDTERSTRARLLQATQVAKSTARVQVSSVASSPDPSSVLAQQQAAIQKQMQQTVNDHKRYVKTQNEQQEQQVRMMMMQQQQELQKKKESTSRDTAVASFAFASVSASEGGASRSERQSSRLTTVETAQSVSPAPIPNRRGRSSNERDSIIIENPLRPIEIPESEEEDAPPPPAAALEYQISQQVLANCAASLRNQPTQNQPPPEAYGKLQNNSLIGDSEEEDEAIDEEPIFVDDGEVDHAAQGIAAEIPVRRWYQRKAFLFPLAFAFAGYFLSSGDFLAKMVLNHGENISQATPATTPCYNDFPPPRFLLEEERLEYGDGPCDGHGAPCPYHGVCKNGELIACQGVHYELALDGGHCILSKEANSSLSLMRNILGDWTLRAQCGGGLEEGIKPLYNRSAAPLFEYNKMQLLHPLQLAVSPFDEKVLTNEFRLQESDGKHFVGLKDEHLAQLDYPFGCSVGLSIRAFFKFVIGTFLLCLTKLVRTGWACLSGYPLPTFVGLLVVWLIRTRQINRARRAKVLLDSANVRLMAYRELQCDPIQPHAALHVRDNIIDTMGLDRAYMRTQIWPRVVSEIQQDNRIRKSKRLIDGKSREVWAWSAAITPPVARKVSSN